MYIYLSSTKPEIYSRLPHMHTVTVRLGAPDSGGNYQKKERKKERWTTKSTKIRPHD